MCIHMCTCRLGRNFNVVPQFFETVSRIAKRDRLFGLWSPEILLSSFSKHSGFKHRSLFVCLNLGSWAQELTLVQQAFHWQAFFADCLYNLREFLAWPIWFQNLQQQTSSFLKSLFNFLILHKWCLLSSCQDLAVSSSPWTSPILFYTCSHSAPLQYSTRKWGHAAFISVCLTSLRFTYAITSSKPSSFKTESYSLYKYTYHSSSVYLFFSTDILVDSISWILWIMAYKCYQLYSHPHFNLFFFAFTFVKVPPLSLTLIYKWSSSTKHILRLYKIFPLRSKAFRLRKH